MNETQSFIWNDGGRSAAGYVGYAGDCCARAVAIATGTAYKTVYERLGRAARKTPRNGVNVDVFAQFLLNDGWTRHSEDSPPFFVASLPDGVVIAHVSHSDGRCNHVFAVVNQTIHDTWNVEDDDEYVLRAYWTPPLGTASNSQQLSAGSSAGQGKRQELSQEQFDKILRRLRALDRTAGNAASTEAEKRNAIRMMQQMMLANNLSREDITEKDEDDSFRFTKMQCFVNGRKACAWEKALGFYICKEVMTTVQFFISDHAKRRVFVFYGPVRDVENAIDLFRELLVSIASAAQLQYRSYSRGSGASYCEGYVAGLPKGDESSEQSESPESAHRRELVATRLMTVHNRSREWLRKECNIRLQSTAASGRSQFDPAAMSQGRRDGKSHAVSRPGQPKRLT